MHVMSLVRHRQAELDVKSKIQREKQVFAFEHRINGSRNYFISVTGNSFSCTEWGEIGVLIVPFLCYQYKETRTFIMFHGLFKFCWCFFESTIKSTVIL